MKDTDEARLALGKKADDQGLILTEVGEEYRLHARSTDPERPTFVAHSLAEIANFLDQQIADTTEG